MRTFYLNRKADASGVSGTGKVAEGIEFSDGTVVLRWLVGDLENRSTNFYASITAVEAIHGHDGWTDIVWFQLPTISIPTVWIRPDVTYPKTIFTPGPFYTSATTTTTTDAAVEVNTNDVCDKLGEAVDNHINKNWTSVHSFRKLVLDADVHNELDAVNDDDDDGGRAILIN